MLAALRNLSNNLFACIPNYCTKMFMWTIFLGVFALLMAVGALKYIHSLNPKGQWKKLLIVGGLIAAGAVFLVVVLLTYVGVIAPWSGRLVLFSSHYTGWDKPCTFQEPYLLLRRYCSEIFSARTILTHYYLKCLFVPVIPSSFFIYDGTSTPSTSYRLQTHQSDAMW